MGLVELIVTIGENEECGQIANTATEISDEVERSGVSPVDILKNEHRRLSHCLEFVQQSGKEGMLAIRRLNELEEWAFSLKRDLVQRTERLRREQGVASADEPARSGEVGGKEALHERGLADARFAVNKSDTPTPCFGLLQGISENPKLRVTFQELAGATFLINMGSTITHHEPRTPRGPWCDSRSIFEPYVTDFRNGEHRRFSGCAGGAIQ